MKGASKLRRWGKRLVIIIAVAWVAFVGVSNIFLRTRLFRNLMAFDPEAMTMDYASAYSWFPGRIHVEGLTIRGSDSHLQWFLTVDHADTFMSPFALARRRFHAVHSRADGVTFRVRTRVAPEDVTPELIDALPKIPGFSDPPLKVPVPPDPSDKDYKLWSVDLEDADGEHIRDVWINTLHATGDFRAKGRWLFRPLRLLDLGPSDIQIANLDIVDGKMPIVRGLYGSASIRIYPYDVRVPSGLDVLDQFSGKVKLGGVAPLSDGLNQLLGLKKAHLVNGEVGFAVDVRLDRGTLLRGSHAEAAIEEASVRASVGASDIAVETSAASNFVIDEQSTLRGSIRTTTFDLSKTGAPKVTAALDLQMTSRELRLAHGFGDTEFHLNASQVKSASLEQWVSPNSSDSIWATGAVTAEADLDGRVRDSSARGRIYFSIADATMAHDPLRITTDLSGVAKIANASLDDRALEVVVDVVSPRPITTTLGPMHATSRVDAHVQIDACANEGETRIDLSGSEIQWRDVLADFDAKGTVRLFVAPEVAVRAPSAVLTNGDWKGNLEVEIPRADSQDLSAALTVLPFSDEAAVVGGTASANARASVDLASLAMHGELNVLARNLDVRIDGTPFFGNLGVKVRAVRQANVTDFSDSTVVFARGDATNAPGAAAPWSAKFELSNATWVGTPEPRESRGTDSRWSSRPYFRATVRGQATDASPATLLVSSATGVPTWLTNAFRMRDLKVQGALLVANSRFELRALDARGEGGFVELEYSRLGAMKDGAMVVSTGPLEAGIDLAGGSARLVLIDPESWFKRDVAKIRKNEESRVVAP